jgi:hypothetical protein
VKPSDPGLLPFFINLRDSPHSLNDKFPSKEFFCSLPTEFIQASLNQKKGELENRRQDIVEGLLLRSQANWHENGERCSEYFCKLEKKVLYQQNYF